MGRITIKDIVVNGPVKVQSIKALNIYESVNHHANLEIEGVIEENSLLEYNHMHLLGEPLTISYILELDNSICFAGKITKAEFKCQGKVHLVNISAISSSILFDQERKKRSFQDMSMTYSNVYSVVAGDGRTVIPIIGKDQKLSYPLIQYEETDWEFLLRLAGYLHTVIIPDVTGGYPQLSIGLPKRNTYNLEQVEEYQVIYRSGIYQGEDEIKKTPRERITYEIRSDENMELGDMANLKGEKWIVFEKKMSLEKGYLEIEYVLGMEGAYSIPPRYNPKIQGLSLVGKVLWVNDEQISLWLAIDQEQDISTAYPYQYVPETGNLMYTMPEIGSHVMLYFSEANEKSGFIINCKREEGIIYSDERIKYLHTPKGKGMVFTPHALEFNSKKRKKIQFFRLNDSDGIIISGKQVKLIADGDISVRTEGSSTISSNSYMIISQIPTDNRIEMYGNSIIMEAEQYTAATKEQKTFMTEPPIKKNVPQDCSQTYAALLGALSPGMLKESQARLMAGIPAVSSAIGSISVKNQIGWSARR